MTDTNVIHAKTIPTSTFAKKSRSSLAVSDIVEGLLKWRLWLFLSWRDIKLSYRRSTLGPLWITLSMAITILSMGLLYGKLFKMDLDVYYPFLATGILGWGLISSLILEGMNVFVDSESLIKQIKQPYSMFVFRVVSKVFITFFHNSVILILLAVFFNLKFTSATLFLPITLLLLWLNAIAYGTILSMISARFRDIRPIVTNLMQVVFFITPVMWMPNLMPERYHYTIAFNPFAQFLDLIRAPLLGHMPSSYSIGVVLIITLVGLVSAFCFFAFYRSRIVYWL